MMMSAIILATMLGQFIGVEDGGFPVQRVDRIDTRWNFEGIPAAALGLPPVTAPFDAPDWEPVPQASTTNFQRCFDPDSDEGVVATWKIPPDWKIGTDFDFFLAWSPATADGGDVKWNLYYSGPADSGEAWQATTLETATTAAPAVIDQLTNTLVGSSISGASTNITGGFNLTLVRDADDDADTYEGDVCLAGFIASYQINSIGSDTQISKTQ